MRGLFKLFSDARASSDALQPLRARAHAAALGIMLLVCILLAVFYFFTPINHSAAHRMIVLFIYMLAMLYFASLMATQYTDISGATGYFSSLWTGILVLCLCSVNGGIPLSTATPLIIAPICMSFCFLGLRPGIILSILFILAFTSIGITNLSGALFPIFIETQQEGINQIIAWLGCFTYLLSILGSYEWMIGKVLNQRGGSESLLHQEYYGEKRYSVVTREHFEGFLHEAEERCIQHKGYVVLCCMHLSAGSAERTVNVMKHIQPLLRSIDTLVRTGENTISFVLENVSSEASAQHYINSLSLQLTSADLATVDNFKASYACMPGPCHSWQDLCRSAKPYFSHATPLPEQDKPAPYV